MKKPAISIKFTSLLAALAMFLTAAPLLASDAQTIVVSAEGLADPNAEVYSRDKGLMIDSLRQDARRQVIEKAVGMYVDSTTLVENYVLISDRVLTHSKGIIKKIVKESTPWLGDDGFMHILLKAEVYISSIKDALQDMSRTEKINLIKEHGNPKISVAITIRDAKRGSHVKPERSLIAENILKEHFSKFGYRVWSEDITDKLKIEVAERKALNSHETTLSITGLKAADFTVRGETKFKELNVTLRASGLTITKYALTSWTVSCVDNNTGEEIYFNNKVPRNKSWSDEDAALEDIGKLIGKEFSQGFFEGHLMRSSKIFQLQVYGLPDYDTGTMFKKEMIGLRSILNVDFRNFDAQGLSVYEVEFAGTRGNFNEIVNNTVVKPLNMKFEEKVFKLISAQGEVVKINFQTEGDMNELLKKFNTMPPASLANATPERLKDLIHDKSTMTKVAAINPEAVRTLAGQGNQLAKEAINAVNNF
ncbi:MAG: hypothetical protein KAI90_03530 [Desulfobulbaceae bacterium]|nr:hypothetical protein [Desulfobulbaceae bacterium]MCK5544366.1 hypothetical protein [Desulfobulbaceae bacterium]